MTAFEDMSPEEQAAAEARCHDREFCKSGMLKPGQTLREVIAEDRAALKRLGVTQEQVADVLDAAKNAITSYHRTRASHPDHVVINDRGFDVWCESWMGTQSSPFNPNDRSSVDVFVSDITGEAFAFGGLLPAMIRHQCFFEGGGPSGYPGIDTFRIEPEHVVTFFSILPGVPVTSKAEPNPRNGVTRNPDGSVSMFVDADPFNFLTTEHGSAGLRYA